MKPRTRRTGTLLALAVLLAAISTGGLTICDAFLFGAPEPGGTIPVTVQAGNTAPGIAESGGYFYRFSLCGPLPQGAYLRSNRDTRGDGYTTVDLVTGTGTPPGNYQIPYVESDIDLFGPILYAGTFDLTVTQADVTVEACLYVYSENELLLVNQPLSFYGCCSSSPMNDPIVQYKWWFNYNGNPSSSPDATTTTCQTQHTYASAGAKSVRLVVRTQGGDEGAATETITVVNGL